MLPFQLFRDFVPLLTTELQRNHLGKNQQGRINEKQSEKLFGIALSATSGDKFNSKESKNTQNEMNSNSIAYDDGNYNFGSDYGWIQLFGVVLIVIGVVGTFCVCWWFLRKCICAKEAHSQIPKTFTTGFLTGSGNRKRYENLPADESEKDQYLPMQVLATNKDPIDPMKSHSVFESEESYRRKLLNDHQVDIQNKYSLMRSPNHRIFKLPDQPPEYEPYPKH